MIAHLLFLEKCLRLVLFDMVFPSVCDSCRVSGSLRPECRVLCFRSCWVSHIMLRFLLFPPITKLLCFFPNSPNDVAIGGSEGYSVRGHQSGLLCCSYAGSAVLSLAAEATADLHSMQDSHSITHLILLSFSAPPSRTVSLAGPHSAATKAVVLKDSPQLQLIAFFVHLAWGWDSQVPRTAG